MAIWQAFQHLGCGVCLRPVLAAAPFYQQPRSFDLGKKFDIKGLSRLIETPDEWGSMLKDDWGLERVSFDDVVWLNKPNLDHKQYGNEPSTHLAYSVCTIIIGVPKYEDGQRMRLEATFTCVDSEEESWDNAPPYPDV